MTPTLLRPLFLAAIMLFSAVVCAAPHVVLTEFASGLELPVEIASAHDGSARLYVVEQRGRIRIVDDGKVQPTPFLDVGDLVATDDLEARAARPRLPS